MTGFELINELYNLATSGRHQEHGKIDDCVDYNFSACILQDEETDMPYIEIYIISPIKEYDVFRVDLDEARLVYDELLKRGGNFEVTLEPVYYFKYDRKTT